jgi:hypothetical protein
MTNPSPAALRAAFLRGVLHGLRVTWPILSAMLLAMVALGALVGLAEGWGPGEGIYFAFTTGLTIGYGDLSPTMPFTRILAIAIGFLGVVLMGLLAALGVTALQTAIARDRAAR